MPQRTVRLKPQRLPRPRSPKAQAPRQPRTQKTSPCSFSFSTSGLSGGGALWPVVRERPSFMLTSYHTLAGIIKRAGLSKSPRPSYLFAAFLFLKTPMAISTGKTTSSISGNNHSENEVQQRKRRIAANTAVAMHIAGDILDISLRAALLIPVIDVYSSNATLPPRNATVGTIIGAKTMRRKSSDDSPSKKSGTNSKRSHIAHIKSTMLGMKTSQCPFGGFSYSIVSLSVVSKALRS